jgi:hypothetical protein
MLGANVCMSVFNGLAAERRLTMGRRSKMSRLA